MHHVPTRSNPPAESSERWPRRALVTDGGNRLDSGHADRPLLNGRSQDRPLTTAAASPCLPSRAAAAAPTRPASVPVNAGATVRRWTKESAA